MHQQSNSEIQQPKGPPSRHANGPSLKENSSGKKKSGKGQYCDVFCKISRTHAC
jgi:hypothetical protein